MYSPPFLVTNKNKIMAECDEFTNVPRGCGNNVGTLKRFVFNHQSKLTSVDKNELTGVIDDAVHTEAFLEIEFRKGQAQFTEASAIDLVAESDLAGITVAMNLKRRTGAKSNALRKMRKGQPYIAGFGQDGNDIWWYFPNLQVSTMGGGTGETRAAGTNYDFQMVNEEDDTPWEVSPTVIAALLLPPTP